jgi:hypothetical protein
MTQPELVVIDVAAPTAVTPVFVPGGSADLGSLTARVGAVEASDADQDARIGALEATTVGGGQVQDLVDTAVAAHAQAAEPHTAYDSGVSFRLLFENGLI